MTDIAIKNPSRRSFLLSSSVAAAAGFSLADPLSLAAQTADHESASGFQLFAAQSIQDASKALQAKPGNDSLVDSPNFTVVLTTETAKSAKEFEWHEWRDHVLQILDGSTVVEVGGKPKDGRNTKPGEWLAPASEGATKLTLKKGDMLIIPRGTPHKRTTAESVTLILISPGAPAKS